MPCDTRRISVEETAEQARARLRAAVAKLEGALTSGTASIVVGPTGAVAFKGWRGEGDGLTDVCAFRRLQASNSPALRRALARAEALSGRKVDPRAIAAGVHSHDGGGTWGTH